MTAPAKALDREAIRKTLVLMLFANAAGDEVSELLPTLTRILRARPGSRRRRPTAQPDRGTLGACPSKRSAGQGGRRGRA